MTINFCDYDCASPICTTQGQRKDVDYCKQGIKCTTIVTKSVFLWLVTKYSHKFQKIHWRLFQLISHAKPLWLFHTLVSTLCWYWPECHIFFAKSESSNEGYDRGNRNNPAQSSRILGIRIDNSVTWHRLNFRSFGLSIAVVSVFLFWVFLYNCYFAAENFFKFQKDFGRGWF